MRKMRKAPKALKTKQAAPKPSRVIPVVCGHPAEAVGICRPCQIREINDAVADALAHERAQVVRRQGPPPVAEAPAEPAAEPAAPA